MKRSHVRKFGYIHPPTSKFAADQVSKLAPIPERVVLPLAQHIGKPARLLVEPGDEVRVGERIAEADGFISAHLHASISGVVQPLVTLLSPTSGMPVQGVVIESDGKDQWLEFVPDVDEPFSRKDVIGRIQDAGIVGLGGAAFPTHAKVDRPEGERIHTLLINGAECEPFITSDDRLMIEDSARIVQGARILAELLQVDRIAFCVEENKPLAIAAMRTACDELGLNAEVVSLPSRYPMGAEKTLIHYMLGIEISPGSFPTDVGVVVQNIATAAAIADAVLRGQPMIQRVVTVAGSVRSPSNLIARVGTPACALIAACGGALPGSDRLLFGGPMMGIAQASWNAPTLKSTNCILLLDAPQRIERNCIRCARCIERCPMGLMPQRFVELVKADQTDELDACHLLNCVECGACAYDCPAAIPIVSYIKIGKARVRSLARGGK